MDLTTARTQLGTCEVSGPAELARLWSAASGSTSDVNTLALSSHSLSDSRIFDALVATIRSAARPALVRNAAIDVLVSYAIPDAAYPALSSGTDSATIATVASLPVTGSSPPSAGAASTALSEIQAGMSAGDPEVSAHASQVAPALARAMAARRNVVDPSKISLAYVCGNQFRVRNSNAIGVVLSYDVTGTSETGIEVRVTGPTGGLAYGETVFTTSTRGDVHLKYLGTDIQTATNQGTACP
jgi:hypothetical protein